MALHKKPSCFVKYSLRGISGNHCHVPVCCCIRKCYLNICYSRRNLYWQLISDSQKESGNLWCGQRSPRFSLFLRKMILSSQSQRQTGPSRLSSETSKSTRLSLYGVHQCKQHGWLAYMCEGTIDTEAFIRIILRHILPLTKLLSWEVIVIRSRQCQLSFCTCYNCMAWKTHVDVTDWPVVRSTNTNVWLTRSHGNSYLFFGFCLAFCLLLR